MRNIPNRLVAKYLECDADTEHDVLNFFSALDLKGAHKSVDYGDITAAIWYQTSYLINNTSPLILTIVFGNDFALRSVLGTPCTLVMGDVVDLFIGQLVCLELKKVLMLQLDLPYKGYLMLLPMPLLLLLCMTVPLLMYFPRPRPLNILPPMEQLLRSLRTHILVTLSLLIIIFKAISRVRWYIIQHM